MLTPLCILLSMIGVLTLVAGVAGCVGPIAAAGAVAGAAAGAVAGLPSTGSFRSLPHVYILLAICSFLYLGVLTLVAAGRVAAPDANRITLKRIVLTALPYKLKKVF